MSVIADCDFVSRSRNEDHDAEMINDMTLKSSISEELKDDKELNKFHKNLLFSCEKTTCTD